MKKLSLVSSLISLSILGSLACSVAGADAITDQAQAYNAIFGDNLTGNTNTKIPGVINLRTVLPGFVYRGGSNTMINVPLSETALQNLCEQGFSAAIYTYPTVGHFNPHSVTCSKGTLEYYGFSGENPVGRGKAMDVIADAIQTGKGPVLVHCWNGMHSSGNMAGSALMTFCGESFGEAQSYWKSNAGSPAAQAGSKFEGEAHTGLNLSPEDRAALCGN